MSQEENQNNQNLDTNLKVNDDSVWPPPPQIDGFTSFIYSENHQFKKQNIYLFILWNLLTLGYYCYIWMYKVIKLVNKISPKDATPWFVFIICMAINIFYVVWTNNDLYIITGLADLFVLFSIRTSLNTIFKATKDKSYFSNKIYTFFLGPIYLQYKINKYVDYIGKQAPNK